MNTPDHSFSQYIQILGKGRRGARDMTREEAQAAMGKILAGEVAPVQLGAFLMLMRVKEETSLEMAGFVQAARDSLTYIPQSQVSLDWACYAGKRRQLPWHLLSALLMANHGYSVLMHGVGRGAQGRVYVPDAMSAMGLFAARTMKEADQQLSAGKFAFLSLEQISPALNSLLELKPVLGLRSPVHSLVRMLNPFRAKASMMGIFHPGYDLIHQEAGHFLGDRHQAVFKGEGGEPERNPDVGCTVRLLRSSEMMEQEWAAHFSQRHLKDETMDSSRLLRVWQGECEDEYGTETVIATAAIAVTLMHDSGDILSQDRAVTMARELWASRDLYFMESLSKKQKGTGNG